MEKRQTLKVAGLGNLSLLESHRAYLKKLGDGNMSAGVRRLIDLARDAAEFADDLPEELSALAWLLVAMRANANRQLSEPD